MEHSQVKNVLSVPMDMYSEEPMLSSVVKKLSPLQTVVSFSSGVDSQEECSRFIASTQTLLDSSGSDLVVASLRVDAAAWIFTGKLEACVLAEADGGGDSSNFRWCAQIPVL